MGEPKPATGLDGGRALRPVNFPEQAAEQDLDGFVVLGRIQERRLAGRNAGRAELKEVIGGCAILEVKSKQEAVEIGKEFMQIHLDILGPSYEAEMEVREMAGFWQPGAALCFKPAEFQGLCLLANVM